MQLTLNKNSALRIIRKLRASRGDRGLPRDRTGILAPNPSPRARWKQPMLAELTAPWDDEALQHGPLSICVADEKHRIGARNTTCTVYHGSVPEGAFIRLSPQLAISSPELVFVELANSLSPAERLLLGFELCGGYSRDPDDPIEGKVTFNVPPATSVERIGRLLDSLGRVTGKERARATLRLLADNAWSPFEAVVATMAALPLEEDGYGLGRCRLNERVEPDELMRGAARKGSRVPDILIGDYPIGMNYDGEYHLDLDSLVDAAIRFARDPGSRQTARELEDVKAHVRAQVIDDNRRNRELVTSGYLVFPVFKEDLYDEDGLDATMMQVMRAMQLYGGWEDDGRMEMIASATARAERRELLTSLLPGPTREVEGDVREAIVSLKHRSW